MAYGLFLQPRAKRSLEKAPSGMQPRLKEAMLALASTPRPPGAKKLKGQRDTWRVRVGDWRIVYVPDDARKAVLVTVIAHRREVYE